METKLEREWRSWLKRWPHPHSVRLFGHSVTPVDLICDGDGWALKGGGGRAPISRPLAVTILEDYLRTITFDGCQHHDPCAEPPPPAAVEKYDAVPFHDAASLAVVRTEQRVAEMKRARLEWQVMQEERERQDAQPAPKPA